MSDRPFSLKLGGIKIDLPVLVPIQEINRLGPLKSSENLPHDCYYVTLGYGI